MIRYSVEMNHRPRATKTCAIDGCGMLPESSASASSVRWRSHRVQNSSYTHPAYVSSSGSTGGGIDGAFPASSPSHPEPQQRLYQLPDPTKHLLGLGSSLIAPNRANPVEPKIGPVVSFQGASPSVASHRIHTPQRGWNRSYSLPPLVYPLGQNPGSAANTIHRPRANMPSQHLAGSTDRPHAHRPGAKSSTSDRTKLREVIDLTGSSEDEALVPKPHRSAPDRSMNTPHPSGVPKNHSSLASLIADSSQVVAGREPCVTAGTKLIKTEGAAPTAGQQNSYQDSTHVRMDSATDAGPARGARLNEDHEWVRNVTHGGVVFHSPSSSSAASQANLPWTIPGSEIDCSKQLGISAQPAAAGAKKLFTPPIQPVPKVRGHLQSVASRVDCSHDSNPKVAAAQESSPQALETNNESKEPCVRQSAALTTPRRTKPRRTISSERVYIRADPHIHGMHSQPDKFTGIRARGRSKHCFGNVIGRRRLLRAQACERTMLSGATEAVFRRADPKPWGHQQTLNFGDVPEEQLPDDVKGNPAWLRACKWLRRNRAYQIEMEKAYKGEQRATGSAERDVHS